MSVIAMFGAQWGTKDKGKYSICFQIKEIL